MKKFFIFFFVCAFILAVGCNKTNIVKKEDCSTLGHNYVEHKEKEETCTKEGLIIMECSRCSDSYEEVVPAKGHSNKVQSNGEDICQVCNTKSFTTNSVKILQALIACLKDPQSAKIISIYAGNYTYDNVKYVAVATIIEAKNSYGVMVTGDYLSLIRLDNGSIIIDAVSYAQNLANKYSNEADRSFGANKLELLHKVTESLEMKTDFLRVLAYRTERLNKQDLDYIVKEVNNSQK